jgi:hypothetical protein
MGAGAGCAVPVVLLAGGSMSLNPVCGIGGAAHPSWNFHGHKKPAAWAIHGGDASAMFLNSLERDREPEA